MHNQFKIEHRTIYNTSSVSLVAFYGNKPASLKTLVQELQDCLASHRLTQGKFIPYPLKQVHATIIGCEGLISDRGIISKWFYQHKQETQNIDLAGLVKYLHRVDLPLTIRFGGYDRQKNYNFVSRDRHLSIRSLQIQSLQQQGIPVLIGWAWENNRVTLALDNIRRDFEQFNLSHKYHSTPEAIDNDFYLRLGTIDRSLSSLEMEAIASEIRHLLANKPPLYILMKLEDLAFARYRDLQLTPATTKAIPVAKISAERLEQLYYIE